MEKQRIDLWRWGEGGEGEMYGKSNMETYITICKIDSQQEFAVWLRKLKQGLCIILEGCDGAEMGRRFKRQGIYVYLWLIHVRELPDVQAGFRKCRGTRNQFANIC